MKNQENFSMSPLLVIASAIVTTVVLGVLSACVSDRRTPEERLEADISKMALVADEHNKSIKLARIEEMMAVCQKAGGYLLLRANYEGATMMSCSEKTDPTPEWANLQP